MFAKTNVLILFSIVILCVIITGVFFPQLENFEECPASDAPFSKKRFMKTDTCYSETLPTCLDVVKNIHGRLDVEGLDIAEVVSALSVMNNNTYVNKNDNSDVYSLNQCVISDNEVSNLSMQDCKLNDIQFQKGNPADQDVAWNYENGCVVTEDQLKNNLANIVRNMNEVYIKPKKKTQQDFVDMSNDNKAKEAQNWDEYRKNLDSTAAERQKQREALDKVTRTNDNTKLEKTVELSNNKVIGWSTMEIDKKMGWLGFMRDKVIGLRYEVYHGYFWEDLNHFTKYIAYQTGFINRVNNFEGMRGYPQGTNTWRISVNITGCIRPDVSGTWEFALISDDASFMWITPITTDYSAMTTTMKSSDNVLFIDNRGWHGDVRKEGKITLKGLDSDSKIVGYNIRIVQGNDGGPGSLRVEMKKPGSGWEMLGGDNFLFSPVRKGLTCKVSRGYFHDNTQWLNYWADPLCAVVIDEIYHGYKQWYNPGFGITGKSKYDNFQRITYTDFNKGSNQGTNRSTHPWTVGNYPFDWWWQRNMNIYGWWIPPVVGQYTFYLASDDASYLWIGDAAESNKWYPWNAMINNGGYHGTIMRRTNYYVSTEFVKTPIPFRIVQGDWGGDNTLMFSYRKPGDVEVTYDITKDFRC